MEDKILKAKSAYLILFFNVLFYFLLVAATFITFNMKGIISTPLIAALIVLYIILFISNIIISSGFIVIKPNEAIVFTLFGNYYGTVREDGFFFLNPFVSGFNPASRTELSQSGDVKVEEIKVDAGKPQISLKAMTLINNKQKINDLLGNPVEVGIAVVWKVVSPAAAVFNVDNYKLFLSLQCDIALRNIVRKYPYDVAENVDTTGDGVPDEGSLRGSSELVAKEIKDEIQEKVKIAGLEIVEARITHLAYAEEIASVMLQRQQAKAIIDARKTIVEGAVGMVDMALSQLKENNTIELDEERKAAMVSNLLVVLCGNKDTQPIVNSGSLY